MRLRYAEGGSDLAQQLHSFSGLDRCGVSWKGRPDRNEVLGSDCGASWKGRPGNHEVLGLGAQTSRNNFMCAVRCFNAEGAVPVRCNVKEGIIVGVSAPQSTHTDGIDPQVASASQAQRSLHTDALTP